ncbi:hypothetical protein [Chelatococcus reniformis]|uniref:hypothetical protein n=1 Tax=Chelatococcus reniformis TaxID=1494448 RepID=UPI0016642734|nr:hypothetical protein [Chelatococcus reniformis]
MTRQLHVPSRWRRRGGSRRGAKGPLFGLAALAATALVVGGAIAAPAPAGPPRTVAASQVTVVTGSIFRVGSQAYQISGMRTARIARAQCFYEKRVGRAAQRALRRMLARGPIEVTPVGGTSLMGAPFVAVKVKGQDVRQRMIARGYAIPRAALNDRRNPWCVQP